MSAWTDDYLAELQDRGEIELSTDVPHIFHRFSLAVTDGDPDYTLPEGIVSISRLTWKGKRVWPYDERTARVQGIYKDPFTETVSGTPQFYLQHNQGMDQITFWPTPNESIGADDSGIWTNDIANRVIISCWKVAVPSGSDFRVPEFLRRRILKYYVNMRAYAKEGPSQNIEAAMYFRDRYVAAKQHLQEVMDKVPRAIYKQFEPLAPVSYKPPRPVLPSNFGRIVE